MIELQNICFEYGSEEQNIAGRGALHNSIYIFQMDRLFYCVENQDAERQQLPDY